MKMVLAILHKNDEFETVESLTKNKFFVTKLATSGGFLKDKNVTLLVGVEDERVQEVIRLIKESAGERRSVEYTAPPVGAGGAWSGISMMHPISVDVGGSTIFVLNVEEFRKF